MSYELSEEQAEAISSAEIARFRKYVAEDAPDKCWEWTGSLSTRGYARFYLRHHMLNASRVAWWIANGAAPPRALFVCHSCDNARCVNPSHLWLGTQSDNMRDMVQKGRSTGQRYPQKNYANLTRVPMPGEKNHQAKLTASDVRAIRAASGTRAVLAARFGVSRSTIKRIRTWNGWLHLGPRPADRQTEAGQ